MGLFYFIFLLLYPLLLIILSQGEKSAKKHVLSFLKPILSPGNLGKVSKNPLTTCPIILCSFLKAFFTLVSIALYLKFFRYFSMRLWASNYFIVIELFYSNGNFFFWHTFLGFVWCHFIWCQRVGDGWFLSISRTRVQLFIKFTLWKKYENP